MSVEVYAPNPGRPWDWRSEAGSADSLTERLLCFALGCSSRATVVGLSLAGAALERISVWVRRPVARAARLAGNRSGPASCLRVRPRADRSIVAGLGLAGLALLNGRLARGVCGRRWTASQWVRGGRVASSRSLRALGEKTLGGYVESTTRERLAIGDWVIEPRGGAARPDLGGALIILRSEIRSGALPLRPSGTSM